MYWLYNLALRLTSFFLGFAAWFNPKIRKFVRGREESFPRLLSCLSGGDKLIWVHTASLGEYEQGLPVIKGLRANYPSHKILITFFSPSGYEVKKDSSEADCLVYLPLDLPKNVSKFLDITRPSLAIFVKYEVWPNYYRELSKRGVPLLMISARFKDSQAYFRWYGGFMRKALGAPDHFFVQDEHSMQLLKSIGLSNSSISGDSRFDRVAEILGRDNSLPFLESFRAGRFCLVGGSTWPEDEAILVDYINSSNKPIKYVLAPHDIKADHIKNLRHSIQKRVAVFSDREEAELQKADVLIVDTIGLLTRIYSYADAAYVGGGFATGLHNTLEPAVFGIPVLIGPQFGGFKEASDLVALKGVLVVTRREEFKEIMDRLYSDKAFREATGKTNATYVQQHRGASSAILEHIRTLL